ncbi:MAG: hypothetical protein AB7O68_02510 [Pirellulales bacterium]
MPPLVFAVLLVGCNRGQRGERVGSLPPVNSSSERAALVEIPLAESPGKCQGIDWPIDGGGYAQFWALESPATVQITFKTLDVFRSYSKVTAAEQRDGRIVRVTMAPCEETVSFDVAVNHVLERILSNVAPDDDEPLAKAKSWQAAGAEPDQPAYSLRFDSSIDGVHGFCEIKRVSSSGLYYISLDLYDLRGFGANE